MKIRKNSNSNGHDYGNNTVSKHEDDKSKIVLLENQNLSKAENDNYECENPDILDFDYHHHNPPNAVIIPEFSYELKPHQIHAIHFLYKACIGTLEKFRQGDLGSGAILAHCMGLGKTFESIAFISTVFSHNELCQKLSKVLIIVPPKLIQKWQNEFEKFCQNPKISVQTLIADQDKKENKRLEKVQNWFNSKTPEVLIMGNFLFRNANKDLKAYLQKPDIVFYDEAHQGLKNAETVTHQAFNAIVCKRRILLTGTPSPNDLVDYYTLIHLANPSLLGTKEQFDEEYKHPIARGSYKKATVHDIEYMERCCARLKERVKDTVDFQSQEYDKHDFVLGVALTKPQIILYGDYLE
uniref:Helicase ATP-binding domain-containing protein n=1 Tax=Panagrolaimus superbus TaxID=310955 RepID=A0A914Y4X9_9BILA